MKILFFLALLANLVFFLWQYNTGGFYQAANESEQVTASTKQIWLLSELEKKPPVIVASLPASPVITHQNTSTSIISQPEQSNRQQHVDSQTVKIAAVPKTTTMSPVAAVTISQIGKNNPQHPMVSPEVSSATSSATTASSAITPAVKTLYCYRIKGFTDKAAATHWKQQQSVDVSSLQIKETQPVVTDYVVNYPAATLAESKKNIEFLKERGMKSFFIINKGEFKGAISLGVFKNENRAINAQQALIQKGINAKVSKRYKTAATVSAQIQTEQTRSQLLATLKKYTLSPRVELLPQCE